MTIKGGNPEGVVAKESFERFYCTHLVTAADQAAGTYSNVASIAP